MARTELRDAQRQVAVRLDALPIDEHVPRAVHRLDREDAILGFGDEHVGPVVFPVPRLLPQHAIEQLRRLDLDVAGLLEAPTHVRLDGAPERVALRVPEHAAHRLFLRVEQAEVAADAAMVALLGFLEARQVRLQRLLVRPRGAVDALEHCVLRVAAPVGARDLHQLERAELAGAGHVRTAAQVEPVALPVQADVFVRGDGCDDLGLVVLAELLERLDRLVARHELALDLEVGLGELVHLRFELRQVFRRERPAEGEVVIEAVLDHGADGDLRFGVHGLHGLREQVRRGVTDDFEPVRVLAGDDRNLRIPVEDVRGIHELAVDTAGERGLGEPRTDARSEACHGHGLFETALAAVRQGDDRHRLWSRQDSR